MGKVNFSDDFKRDAVAQITERGYPVAEVSQRLGVSPHSLYARKKKFSQPSGDDKCLGPLKLCQFLVSSEGGLDGSEASFGRGLPAAVARD